MSEFVVEISNNINRLMGLDKEDLTYSMEMNVFKYDFKKCSISISRPDDIKVWSPFLAEKDKIFACISGRIALDPEDWEKAKKISGTGGLACKYICAEYLKNGKKGLGLLNGSYIVILYDQEMEKLFITTDRCGMAPAFISDRNLDRIIIGSHPDIVNKLAKSTEDYDYLSMAQFLSIGKVTFPNSYYIGVKALDSGCIYEFNMKEEEPVLSKQRYFLFDFDVDHNLKESFLSEELAEAFKKSVKRRLNPIFGKTGISLSGGLDSRMILAAGYEETSLETFCFYDEENLEFDIAKKISIAAGVDLIPLKRDFEYYGKNAKMGVKISGGMGDFGSNHYFGFINDLREKGFENILSGFYMDYMFKGLEMDKKKNRWTQWYRPSEFRYSNYMEIYEAADKYREALEQRMQNHFKIENNYSVKQKILENEKRRFIPLHSEVDHMETVIPQKIIGWYLPITDNDVLNVYKRIPPEFKINGTLYSMTVEKICGKKISRIINTNTGARVNPPYLTFLACRYMGEVKRYMNEVKSKFKAKKMQLATEGSWPNWDYYIDNSTVVKELWDNYNPVTNEILSDIIGKQFSKRSIEEYYGEKLKYFLRLLTLKIWLDSKNESK